MAVHAQYRATSPLRYRHYRHVVYDVTYTSSHAVQENCTYPGSHPLKSSYLKLHDYSFLFFFSRGHNNGFSNLVGSLRGLDFLILDQWQGNAFLFVLSGFLPLKCKSFFSKKLLLDKMVEKKTSF